MKEFNVLVWYYEVSTIHKLAKTSYISLDRWRMKTKPWWRQEVKGSYVRFRRSNLKEHKRGNELEFNVLLLILWGVNIYDDIDQLLPFVLINKHLYDSTLKGAYKNNIDWNHGWDVLHSKDPNSNVHSCGPKRNVQLGDSHSMRLSPA